MGNKAQGANHIQKLILALALAVGASAPSLALAGPLACKFQQRTNDFYFRHLPKEIVGWVNCANADSNGASESASENKDELNVLYVARMPSTDTKQLLDWFHGYERTMVPAMLTSKIVEKAPAWLEIESKRELGSMTHYVFTAQAIDGTTYAFVYTDNSERARELRARVTSLRQVLSKQAYVSAISSELP